MFGNLADQRVRIVYANMSKINKVRAWARRNGAVVNVTRYAKDAYEGHVNIHSPWNEHRDVAVAKAADLKTLLAQSS